MDTISSNIKILTEAVSNGYISYDLASQYLTICPNKEIPSSSLGEGFRDWLAGVVGPHGSEWATKHTQANPKGVTSRVRIFKRAKDYGMKSLAGYVDKKAKEGSWVLGTPKQPKQPKQPRETAFQKFSKSVNPGPSGPVLSKVKLSPNPPKQKPSGPIMAKIQKPAKKNTDTLHLSPEEVKTNTGDAPKKNPATSTTRMNKSPVYNPIAFAKARGEIEKRVTQAVPKDTPKLSTVPKKPSAQKSPSVTIKKKSQKKASV